MDKITNLDTNRSFLYGDGFFETFKLIDGKCERFALHFQRILNSFSILQMDYDKDWIQEYFEEKLWTESKKFQEKILKTRITFYREANGNYLPESNLANFHIKMEPYFPTNKTLLMAGIYPLVKKPVNFLSSLKSTSSLIFVMAAKYMKESGWDEIIILNEYGRVCEALTSNIFIKKGNNFYTPPISEGCVDGVTRKVFILENKNVIEKPIELDELINNPIYFTNAVRGMIEGKLVV